jgi:hypothetical protein
MAALHRIADERFYLFTACAARRDAIFTPSLFPIFEKWSHLNASISHVIVFPIYSETVAGITNDAFK